MQYAGIHGYIGHGVEANAVKGSLSGFSKPLAMLGVQRGGRALRAQTEGCAQLCSFEEMSSTYLRVSAPQVLLIFE